MGRSQTKGHGARPLDSNPLLFLPAVGYSSGGKDYIGTPGQVAVADLNGDAKPDVVMANYHISAVDVLMGNGDGTLQPAVSYFPGGQFPVAIAIADVNGDGKPDLIVVDQCSTGCEDDAVVSVLLGNGDGTFQSAVAYDSGGTTADSVAVADVNHDGKLDLIVSNYGTGTVGVLLGNGDGTFQPVVDYGAGAYFATWLAVADVNGDGNPDLLVTIANGTVAVLLGNGDGTFKEAVAYSSGGSTPTFVAVTDVNGDDKPDLVVANSGSNTVAVLYGDGDGTFQLAVVYDSGGQGPNGLAVADVNGDNKLDLVVANSGSNTVGVLLGNGNGAFQTALTYSTAGNGGQAVVVADLNRDGKPDLVVGNPCDFNDPECSYGIVGVLLNDGNFTTTTITSSPNPSAYGQAVAFTAVVSSASGSPTGTAIFYDGSTVIGSATLTRVESRTGAVTVVSRWIVDSAFASSPQSGLAWFCFLFPLIEPDRRISRIRLSEKTHASWISKGSV